MAKNDLRVRQCQRFFCQRDGEPRCCADCPDKCSNPCRNSPLKCGLVVGLTVDKPKPGRYKFDTKLARKHYDQGWSDASIAREFGCSDASIRHWRVDEGLPANKSWRR